MMIGIGLVGVGETITGLDDIIMSFPSNVECQSLLFASCNMNSRLTL